MAKEKTESLDEIVFRNRYKDYGAYYLRKVYKKYVTRALIISITALTLAVGIPFLIFTQNRIVNVDKTISAELANLNKPPEDAPPPPPPPPPPEAMEQKVKFTAPVVTSDTTVETASLNQEEMNQAPPPPPTDEIQVVEDTKKDVIVEQAPPVFTIVEEMPAYPGGDEARIKFLQDNIKYPQMAKESSIQGKVYITFVVDENGRVIDVKILRGIGGGCDEEALRVVKIMPPWIPGKQAGKAVRVQYNMPVVFTLQ
ncbi:MAG: TonB family protein [Bacteroidales bacterium]|nr:TonB family protein [Bacteroidales bacterium]